MLDQIFNEVFTNPTSLSIANLAAPSDEDTHKIFLANFIMDILSIVGCAFNLIITIILRASDYSLGKMVVQLCIMDLLYNGISIIQFAPIYSEIICQMMSFGAFFGYAGSLACTCCFAHALYMSVKHRADIIDQYYKRYTYIGIIAGIIGGLLSVAIQYNGIEESTGLCWHYSRDTDIYRISGMIIILPVTVSLLYCFTCYIPVMSKLKEINKRNNLELLLYPLILIVCYLPIMYKAVLLAFNAHVALSLGLNILFNVLFNAQGFLNAFAYGLSQRIITGLKAKCCKKRLASVTMKSTFKHASSFGSNHRYLSPGASLLSADSEAGR